MQIGDWKNWRKNEDKEWEENQMPCDESEIMDWILKLWLMHKILGHNWVELELELGDVEKGSTE